MEKSVSTRNMEEGSKGRNSDSIENQDIEGLAQTQILKHNSSEFLIKDAKAVFEHQRCSSKEEAPTRMNL